MSGSGCDASAASDLSMMERIVAIDSTGYCPFADSPEATVTRAAVTRGGYTWRLRD